MMFCDSRAASLTPTGCAINHCTPEATSVITQPLIQTVITSNSNSVLGTMQYEGCSGNGTRLMCLYAYDAAPASKKGTLKVLDATTLKAIWGSAAAPNSYNLDPTTATYGQVPVSFADGSIAAGDAHYHVLYNSSGAVIGQLPLDGIGNNLGLTPLSSAYGVVSQGDGVLTLVNLATWQNVGTLVLVDPLTQAAIRLVGPSSGTSDVLYVEGYNSLDGGGVLFSVALDENAQQLTVRSTFSFTGQSGATPVVVTPSVSGLPNNLVLLHVPGLIGDPQPQNRLLGLSDSSVTGLAQSWAIPLSAPLAVAPTIDDVSMSLFYRTGSNIYQADILSGTPIQTFSPQAIGGFPASFKLIGHLGASQVGSVFTLLLSGTYATSKTAGEQLVIEFQPIASPTTFVWTDKISNVSGGYTGGWNFAPSTQSGVMCPIAISMFGSKTAIVRLCDH